MNRIPIYPYDFVVKNGSIWFYHASINALFCFEPDKGMHYVTTIRNNKAAFDDVSYFRVLEKNNKLYFIPYAADVLFKYSLDSGEIIEMEVPARYKSKLKFIDAYIIDDYLFCVPLYSSMDLLRYSIKDGNCCVEKGWSECVSSLSTHLDTGTRINDNTFCTVIYKTNKLAIYNTINQATDIVDFDFIIKGIHSCVCLEDRLYLSEIDNNNIHIVDVESMKKIGELKSRHSGFRIFQATNKNIVVSPFEIGEDIEVHNVSTGENKVIELKKTEKDRKVEYPGGSVATDEKGQLYYYDRKANEMICISTNERYSFFYNSGDFPELYSDIWKNSSEKGEIVKESSYFGLEELIVG